MSQTAEQFTKTCAVYVSRTDDVVLVATVLNHGGLYAEVGSVVECSAPDHDRVAQLVQEKLDGCRFEPQFNYRDRKKSDWPAYQTSRMKTLAAFERRFVRMQVDGLHFGTSQWQAVSPPFFNGACLQSVSPWIASTPEGGEWLIELARFFIEVEKKTAVP